MTNHEATTQNKFIPAFNPQNTNLSDLANESLAVLALSLSKALSLKHLDLFYKCYGSYQSILNLSPREFQKIEIIKKDRDFEGKETLLKRAEEVRRNCHKQGVRWVTIVNSDYPFALREIYLPPLVLYYKTNDRLPRYFLADKKCSYLAVVGTRRSDEYFENLTEKIAYQFTLGSGHIISGLALGIDRVAHLGALRASKGKSINPTTAVMACGIDTIYPYANRQLFSDILDCGGVILSEQPPGVLPATYLFPLRNRIISGLSEAILVTQAPEKSGALITVKYALDQGRTIFSFNPPRSVNDPELVAENVTGNLKLIEQGAIPVNKPEELFHLSQNERVTERATLRTHNYRYQPPKIKRDENNKELKLLDELTTPKSIHELMEILNLDFSQINELLMEYLLLDKIKELPGGRYYAL